MKKRTLKDRNVTIAFKKPTYDATVKIASMKDCSTNHLINVVMEDFVNKNQSIIQRYDELYKNE